MDFAFPVLNQPTATLDHDPQLASPKDTLAPPKRLPLTAFSTVTHVTGPNQEASQPQPLTSPSSSAPGASHADHADHASTSAKAVPAGRAAEVGARSQVDYLRASVASAPGTAHAPLRDVPMQELQQHRTAGDAWLSIKGRVYDITRYLKFHPGGARILVKAAGTDATELFNKHHRWIDADYILASSAVGRLKADDQQAPPRLPGITEEGVPTEGQQGGGTRQPTTHSGGQTEGPPSSELGALTLESKGVPEGRFAGDKQRREPEAPA